MTTILSTWTVTVAFITALSVPLRFSLLNNLWADETGTSRTALLERLRAVVGSKVWAVNKVLGTVMQALMLCGALLTVLAYASTTADASVRRAVLWCTLALASRTIVSILYFSLALVRPAQNSGAAAVMDEATLAAKQAAIRARLHVSTWAEDQAQLACAECAPANTQAAFAQQLQDAMARLSPEYEKSKGSGPRSVDGEPSVGSPSSVRSRCSSASQAASDPVLVPTTPACTPRGCGAAVALSRALSMDSTCSDGGMEGADVCRTPPTGRSTVTIPSAATQQECPCTQPVACPVCLEDLQPSDSVARVPCPGVVLGGRAGHVFHEACILPWLARQARCPLCCHQLE